MDTEALRRLHYITAIACGVFAALALHIVLTVLGFGLDRILRDAAGVHVQFDTALAWWGIAAAGFVGGWGTSAYLIAAAQSGHIELEQIEKIIGVIVVGAGLLHARDADKPSEAQPTIPKALPVDQDS